MTMFKRVAFNILPVLLLVILCKTAGVLASDEVASSALAIRIVPTMVRGGIGTIDLANVGDHFHVVLTNTSTKPVRIWREWCSWGYFGLSFEARDQAGKAVVLSKRQRGWDKNFPDWTELAPGESTVIDVNLDPSVWENSPLSDKSGEARISMRAVYEIKREKDSDRYVVWKGRASSPQFEYRLYWRSAERTRMLKPVVRP